MYGDDKVTSHPDSAQAFMQEAIRDMGTMAARFQAALAAGLKYDAAADQQSWDCMVKLFGTVLR